jgi:uncharacterized protein
MKLLKITVGALLVLGVAALAGVGRPEAAGGAAEETHGGITVTGTGEIRATPDRASLSFSIRSDAATAKEALAANSAAVRRLIAALKGAGVEAKDLKTEQFDVSPRYHPNEVEEARGYSAWSMLTVGNQSLERAGRLSDIGLSAGADTISGPALSIADREAEYRAALKRAFADARAKAQALAEASGASLGDVTSIVEGSQPEGYYAQPMRALDANMPIEPGSEQVTAAVTVTFALGG